MHKIMTSIVRRHIASAGRGVAANGGQNKKATTSNLIRGLQGVGRGDSNLYGPRRFAGQDFTPQAAGFDSRVVHPSL